MFYPAAEFLVTTRITRVESEPFKSEGKVLVNPGWLAVYGKEAQGRRRRDARARCSQTKRSRPRKSRSNANQTKPPARFYGSDAAQRDGRRGQTGRRRRTARSDEREGPRHSGHARGIIEGLIYEKYVHAQGRELQATAKAFSLMTLAPRPGHPGTVLAGTDRRLGIQAAPDAARQVKREEFMSEIAT